MPNRIVTATGNFTAAATWKAVSAATNAAQLSATVTAQALTVTAEPAAPSGAQLIAGNNDVIDGILVWCAGTTGSPTGTVSCRLRNVTGASDVETVTINASDLPVNGGWVLFKLSANRTLTTAQNFAIQMLRSSVAVGVVNFNRDATAANWHRSCRTTTTGAPAAGERLWIGADFTGAGAQTNYTVTQDNTAATDFGQMEVSKGGTLNWSVNIAALIRTSGVMNIWDGGVMNMGTVGTPVQSGSSAILEFDCTTSGEFGLIVQNGGTLVAQGAALTNDRALINMAGNLQAAGTSITTDISTAWLSGDIIGIAASLRGDASTGISSSEARALSVNAAGTTLTLATGVTFFHSGNAPTQAELINLTRNVKIRNTSAGNPVASTPTVSASPAYVNCKALSVVDLDWVELRDIGNTATTKRGVEIETTTGSFSMNRCAVHSCPANGIFIAGATANNITVSNCVTFNMAHTTFPGFFLNSATSGASIAITDNVFLQRQSQSGAANVYLNDIGITFSNNVMSGGGHGLRLNEATTSPGTFASNTIHSTSVAGIFFSNAPMSGLTLDGLKIYRCTNAATGVGYGLQYDPSGGGIASAGFSNHTYINAEVFGCTDNALFTYGCTGFVFSGCNFHGSAAIGTGDTASASQNGFRFSGAGKSEWVVTNCNFGTSATGKTAHTQGDWNIGAGTGITAVLESCSFGNSGDVAPARMLNLTNLLRRSDIRSQRENGTATNHLTRRSQGRIFLDSSTFNTAAPSERMEPNANATITNKLESGRKKIAVQNGLTIAPQVWVRKNGSYVGNQPRLVLKANVPAGVSTDTVLATMSAGADTWQQLVGSSSPAVTDDAVLEAVVDCDGGAGAVYVDDWTVP